MSECMHACKHIAIFRQGLGLPSVHIYACTFYKFRYGSVQYVHRTACNLDSKTFMKPYLHSVSESVAKWV